MQGLNPIASGDVVQAKETKWLQISRLATKLEVINSNKGLSNGQRHFAIDLMQPETLLINLMYHIARKRRPHLNDAHC